jgi:hypothetical protein
LRALGVNFSVPDPDLIDPVHQLGDEIEVKARRAEGRDLLLRREDHLRVLNRVIEIVFSHHRSDNVRQCSLLAKRNAAMEFSAGRRFTEPLLAVHTRAEGDSAQSLYSVTGIAIPGTDRLRHCMTASPVKIASAIQINAKVTR